LRIGPIHGDAHHGNVVVGDDGAARFVDLGEWRPRGVQALDAIGCAVDARAAELGVPWPVALRDVDARGGDIEHCDAPPELRRALFGLYRIGIKAAYTRRRTLASIARMIFA
jgi:hypothetical protein